MADAAEQLNVKTIEEWKLVDVEGRARVRTAWRAFDRDDRFVESYHYTEAAAKKIGGGKRRVEAATIVEIEKDDGTVVYILAQFGLDRVWP